MAPGPRPLEFWPLWPQVTRGPKSGQRSVHRSTQAFCLLNSADVPDQRLGEPGQLEAKEGTLNLTPRPSSSLKLPLEQRATPYAQRSTEVRQGSWVPQGQRCSPRIHTASHGRAWGGGEVGGGDAVGLHRPHRGAPAAESIPKLGS